jgi:ABC-type glycerol-3-phosphate transport system substrate-binding protein
MKWISRSILLLMVAAGAMLLALGPRPHGSIPKGRVVVQYWEKWSGLDAEPMRAVVDDFNATVGAEKGIFVEYIAMSTVQYKTLAATAAGVPPDVAGLWPDQVVQYALRDAARPLDDLARDYHIRGDDYKKVFWDQCTYQGKLFALPTTPRRRRAALQQEVLLSGGGQALRPGPRSDQPAAHDRGVRQVRGGAGRLLPRHDAAGAGRLLHDGLGVVHHHPKHLVRRLLVG